MVGDYDCVAGDWCNFTITAFSAVGLPQYTGGDLWFAMVTGRNEGRKNVVVKGTVSDQGNGTYNGRWMAESQVYLESFFLSIVPYVDSFVFRVATHSEYIWQWGDTSPVCWKMVVSDEIVTRRREMEGCLALTSTVHSLSRALRW